MSKLHWSIDIKQVDNGYVLKVYDQNQYKGTETVYCTIEEAMLALRKSVAHIKNDFLALASGEKGEQS